MGMNQNPDSGISVAGNRYSFRNSSELENIFVSEIHQPLKQKKMKKLIGLLAIVFFASVAFAQTTPVKQEQKKAAAKTEAAKPAVKAAEKPAEKAAVKAAEKPAEKAAVKAAEKPAEKAAVKVAEKPAEKSAAPTKKDGTPDMRYKANKEAAKTAPAAPAAPTKKDGTPDKRYKENKEAPKTEKK